jgi:hypothetical protein
LTAVGDGSPASLAADLQALYEDVSDGEASGAVLVMAARAAWYLANQRVDGVPEFPDLTVKGGSVHGVPVLITRAAGNRVILLDAAKLAIADNGLDVAQSQNAAVLMDDSPSLPNSLVSLFQTDSVGLRFTRHVSWTWAADDGAAFLELSDLGGSPSGSPAW